MYEQIKMITFCKIPFIKIKETINYKKYYFLGLQYKNHHNTEEEIRKTALDQFSKAYPNIKGKNVIVILNNIGETVFYARTAKYWYKDNSLVGCIQASNQDIFKLYAPEVSVFHISQDLVWRPDYLSNATINNNSFQILLSNDDLIELNSSGLPFWQNWRKRLNMPETQQKYQNAVISDTDKVNAENKAKGLGIDINKFILIIPEANSILPISNDFWKNIKEKLISSGYSILENSKIFSITEIYHLASLAKGIIALRSGLCDFLCELKIPQFVIYGENTIHGDLQPMYSFKDIPWAAHQYINEYNTHHQSLDNIQSDILSKIGVL